MELVADLHIHTVASDHAFSTVKEITDHARQIGLAMVGISEHGPACPDPVHEFFFGNGHRIPKELDGLQIRFGIEDDIVDMDGNLGLPLRLRENLDYIMVGLHGHTWLDDLSENRRTDAVINALQEEPRIKVLTHPGVTNLTVVFDPVLDMCKKTGTCVELNNSKMRQKDKVIELLEKAADREIGVVVNSDAHIWFEVGQKDTALDMIRETGFPEELVVNTSLEKINRYLGI